MKRRNITKGWNFKLANGSQNRKKDIQKNKEIEFLVERDDAGEIIKTPEMKEFEEETGKNAIWRGSITESFKKWIRGEKVYDRDKERISLYVSEDTKLRWQEFLKESNLSTLSKLVRQSVKNFIETMEERESSANFETINPKTISNVSHSLKEPLTNIKAGAQLAIENFRDSLSEDLLGTIQNIFDQSVLLENKIVKFLDNIKTAKENYEILLIEDDISTINLITKFFESKGISCKGVVSGSKGLEELKTANPDVILLDILLPDLSGYEICKTLKSDNEYKKIPVYFLTATAGSEVEKKLDETGADGYILKPFNFSDFNEIFKIIEASGGKTNIDS
jgi:CheY-like chemotaxis protein